MKRITACALLCLTLVALASCRRPAPVRHPIVIEFWHALIDKNSDVLDAIADRFNASQGAYVIVPVYKGSYLDTMNAGLAAFRINKAPAIIQVYEVGTATMMAVDGAIKPVYRLMKEAHQKFDPRIYIPAVRSYYSTSDGDMLSLPFNASTAVMYYNKDAFRAAGLDPDKPPATWPEFFDAARRLKASGMEGGFTTDWLSWIQLENFSAWHDQAYSTRSNGFDGLDTELAFDTPLVRRHLEAIAGLGREGVFMYGGRENMADPLFSAGRVGMHFQSIGGYVNFKKTCAFDFGVARLPYYPDVPGAPRNSIIGGASLWVFNGKSDEEYRGVAEFFSFLSTTEIQAYWHQNTGYLPITMAAYELTKSQGYYEADPGPEVAIRQLLDRPPTDNSRGVRLGNFVIVREIEDTVWEDILSGSVSVADGLAKMTKEGNKALRAFERLNK